MKTNIIFMGNGGNFELTSLRTVIDRKLVIPSYQRPYAWDEDNIEDLFNTIKESFEIQGNQSAAFDANNRHPAFFGSVIFSTQDHNKYLVIDGQQRVTTFLFVLRIIQERLEKDKDQILKKLAVLDKVLDEAQEKNDIKKSKDIFGNRMKIETKYKDHDKLIKEITSLLLKTNISRETTENNENKTIESEYINYINGKSFKESKDFQKNKNKIFNLISTIIDDMPLNTSDEYEKYSYVIDYILNTVKFCLLNIQGGNSEEYAIDVFNTLNSTGEPLTGFEVFKSKIMQLNSSLDKQQIERDLFHIENSIKKQKPNRKDIIAQTGKLLLYLAVHRDDYEKNKLSDKKFKDQNSYIKKTLTQNNVVKILEEIKGLSDFVVKNWLIKKKSDRAYYRQLSHKDSVFSLKGFDFLRDINHDRVLPVIYKWSEEFLDKKEFNLKSYQKIIELCTAFSCLWRMASHGGASGIDNEYLIIAKQLKDKNDISNAKSIIWNRFKKAFPKKENWLNEVTYSNINKNKTITKFLLALISLKDISSYNLSDWVSCSISDDRNTSDRFGNTILIHKTQKEEFKDNFQDSLLKFLEDPSFNTDIYSDIVDDFTNTQIDQRTNKLSKLIWKKLAEEVLLKLKICLICDL